MENIKLEHNQIIPNVTIHIFLEKKNKNVKLFVIRNLYKKNP